MVGAEAAVVVDAAAVAAAHGVVAEAAPAVEVEEEHARVAVAVAVIEAAVVVVVADDRRRRGLRRCRGHRAAAARGRIFLAAVVVRGQAAAVVVVVYGRILQAAVQAALGPAVADNSIGLRVIGSRLAICQHQIGRAAVSRDLVVVQAVPDRVRISPAAALAVRGLALAEHDPAAVGLRRVS